MLQGPVPLASLSESAMPYAKQMEADIESYLQSGNKDMSSKCLVAQDVLRHVSILPKLGLERHAKFKVSGHSQGSMYRAQ